MARTRYFYDYSPTAGQSEAVWHSLGHHFRIDPVHETYEIGPLHVPCGDRPLFLELIVKLKEGDVLLCHSPCSLGSTASDVLHTLTLMQAKGVETHGRLGKFISMYSYQRAFRMLSTLVTAEAAVRADRTSRSMRSARSAGVKLGRPTASTLVDQAAVADVLGRLAAGETQTSVAASLGVHRRSIRRLLDQQETELGCPEA